jgi:hypothetical protein
MPTIGAAVGTNQAPELAVPRHGMRINTHDGDGIAERRHRREFYQQQGAILPCVENVHSFLDLQVKTLSVLELSCRPVVRMGEMVKELCG